MISKIINFDDVTEEETKKHNLIDHKFLTIHTEY